MQSNGTNESIQSLASAMPSVMHLLLEDQEEDKYAVKCRKSQLILVFQK